MSRGLPTEPDPLMEALADVEHSRWAHWQRYVHGRCTVTEDGGHFVIPRHLVERWESQIATCYADLAEEDKEKDREQVRRYWPLLATLRAQAAAGQALADWLRSMDPQETTLRWIQSRHPEFLAAFPPEEEVAGG